MEIEALEQQLPDQWVDPGSCEEPEEEPRRSRPTCDVTSLLLCLDPRLLPAPVTLESPRLHERISDESHRTSRAKLLELIGSPLCSSEEEEEECLLVETIMWCSTCRRGTFTPEHRKVSPHILSSAARRHSEGHRGFKDLLRLLRFRSTHIGPHTFCPGSPQGSDAAHTHLAAVSPENHSFGSRFGERPSRMSEVYNTFLSSFSGSNGSSRNEERTSSGSCVNIMAAGCLFSFMQETNSRTSPIMGASGYKRERKWFSGHRDTELLKLNLNSSVMVVSIRGSINT
ncbi:unnamed protein product [Pleuronectes platessa]|uniref:Uncharacterized protein n=1 Tax=Pleuronectes platessa TaxID=8262 RepID=A0A9N7URB6_PLEPL|nr:unnamed protein product [Pleuronectes platessa]